MNKIKALIEDVEKADSDWHFWDWVELFREAKDAEYKELPFDDLQRRLLRLLLISIADAMDFHETNESSHEETLLKEIRKLKEELRQHRHQTYGAGFSARGET